MAQLPKITTLSHGFRILRVWWRFVYVAVLSFIVNVECISRFPSSELVSATWSSSRNAFNGIPYCLRADLRRLPEADIIRKRLRESSHAEARDPGNRYGEGRNFTIHLLWNQFASSTGAKVSMTNRTPPPLSPPPPPSPSADDACEDDDIEFHSDESDGNDGVEDEARFHSYVERQLASKALFFRSWWATINVRMDDPFQWKTATIECQ